MLMKMFALAGIVLSHGAALATDLPKGVPLQLSGVFEPGNLSGVCRVGEFLVVGADEGERKGDVDTRKVQVLRRSGSNYEHAYDVALPAQGTTEIDVEGIACDGRTIFVVGSHSAARSKVNDERKDKPYKKNLERLEEIKLEASRDAIYAFTLASEGQMPEGSKIVRSSLRAVIDKDKALAKAVGVPSKENGIDIEGLAVKAERLYVAFRGPVLREGWVPILAVSKPTADTPPALLNRYFVNLGGLGVRDIAAVENGFLLIAGPVGDGPPDYRLYFWNGKDMTPGQGSPGGTVRLLGNFPNVPDGSANPEGLALLAETTKQYDLLVLNDDAGVKGGSTVATATLLSISKE